MKICLVCPDDLSVVLFCKYLIQNLKDNGKNTVHVICDIWENDYPYYKEIEGWDVKFIYLKMYRFMNPIKDIKYFFSLYRLFRVEKYDLVFPVTTKPNIYGPIAAYYAKIEKVFCGVWGFGITITRNTTIWQKLIRMIFISLYKYSFSKCTKVWFTNKYDAGINWVLKACGEDKLIVTKNYVNTLDYSIDSVQKESINTLQKELNIKSFESTVVMVSRMSWSKGVREFIESAKLLAEKLPDTKFLLIGPLDDGSPDSVPVKYIKESEQNIQNLFWLGFKSNVKEYYALADIAVYPTYYAEGGYPRGITEPMSMGKPVIATNNISCRDTIDDGETGLIVSEKNSVELANAIEKILSSPSLLKNFGEKSRKKALKEFDENTIVKYVVDQALGAGHNNN